MPEKEKIKPRLLSVAETATYLGISTEYLYVRIAPKCKKPFPIQPIRTLGGVKFDLAEIDAYLDAQGAA